MPEPYGRSAGFAPALQYDDGLRAHMLRIYNYMGLGLAVTGLVAVLVASVPALYVPIFSTPLKWLVMLAPLGFVFFLSFRIESISGATAQTLFWVFCAVMGLSLASVFLVFTGASVARAFFGAAAMFAATSLYGYTTKRDLTQMGSFLMMGLIGVILASVINIFLGSSALQFAISIIGIIVFVGLTAWDTQRIKNDYIQFAYAEGTEMAGKRSVMDALALYLNFVNLFQLLLSLMGSRQE